ncbi:hypothetical protein DMH17_03695 [Raoultella planticola]|nr:hypothetical protein [Raoultella planticola]
MPPVRPDDVSRLSGIIDQLVTARRYAATYPCRRWPSRLRDAIPQRDIGGVGGSDKVSDIAAGAILIPPMCGAGNARQHRPH